MDFIKRFDIELDKLTYFAGELLTGHVIVENIENIKVQGIRVFIRGKSHCQWKVTRAGEKRTVKEDEYYLDHKILLWGKNSTDEGAVPILPRGLHKLPVEYQIPETNLPCSFESKIGRIRYYLRVVINIPYASHPQGIKYFTIIGPHIDCMDPTYLTPTTAIDSRKSCCFCFFGGPVVLNAILERNAYCCGERIKLKAEIQNGSDQKVWLICRFIQHVDYFINRGVLGLRKEINIKVWDYQTDIVTPHQTVTFDQLQDYLMVPVMPPTLLNVSSLVNIYYELKVSLGMERSGEELDISLPVTIATVPFRIPNTPPQQVQFEVASAHVEGGMYISPEFQLGQVYMGDDNDENDETILYRPVYCTIQHEDMEVSNTNNAATMSSRSPCLPHHTARSPRVMAKQERRSKDDPPPKTRGDEQINISVLRNVVSGTSDETTSETTKLLQNNEPEILDTNKISLRESTGVSPERENDSLHSIPNSDTAKPSHQLCQTNSGNAIQITAAPVTSSKTKNVQNLDLTTHENVGGDTDVCHSNQEVITDMPIVEDSNDNAGCNELTEPLLLGTRHPGPDNVLGKASSENSVYTLKADTDNGAKKSKSHTDIPRPTTDTISHDSHIPSHDTQIP